jgi:hypothetical protein
MPLPPIHSSKLDFSKNGGIGLSNVWLSASGVPVWVVGTPFNRAVAQRLWKERPQENHLTGITSFNDVESSFPEDLLLSELDTIDLHHGSHSADPPYTILEVFGTPLNDRINAELSQYGFKEFHTDAAGFCAVRPVPPG